jgi:hypothetical protein
MCAIDSPHKITHIFRNFEEKISYMHMVKIFLCAVKLRLLIFLPFLSLFLFIILKDSTIKRNLNLPILLSPVHENHVTPDSVIIYRAYVEKMDEAAHETRLRLLAFSQCHINEESNISIRTSDGRSYRAIPNPIEGKCPWGWAPNCTWNSFILDAHVQSVGGSYDRVSRSPY